ncbi:hypothetical protein B0H15DRAFT_414215 [Mycena belliarum]|uniref:AMP-dependent synthetase/ligase domain-containing protein n=1 Tax=Mycena belliarum TaxID=1033014 RepID=A0AAD6UK36_9AGAR|nr:hypothetical protein B0H15DRAFT_414215 [Mycena belliae]
MVFWIGRGLRICIPETWRPGLCAHSSVLDDREWNGDRLPLGAPPQLSSVGRLLPETGAKAVDAEDNDRPPVIQGQLCVRGPRLSSGYLGNPAATQGAFDAEGFLRTGDIAEITADMSTSSVASSI